MERVIMLKDLMARFGIGSAHVDLILDRHQFRLGETVEGKIVVQGGQVTQTINKIDVQLMMKLHHHGQDHTIPVTEIPQVSTFVIQPGDRKEWPFRYTLPYHLLLSGHQVAYYFTTHVDIAGGVDHTDHDFIQILPPPPLQAVLTALEQLGFRETHDSRKFDGHAQEFEFSPVTSEFSFVKELEFVTFVQPNGIRLLLEVEIMHMEHEQEVKRELFFPHQQLQDVTEIQAAFRHILNELTHQTSHLHTSFHSPYDDHHYAPFGDPHHSPYGAHGHGTHDSHDYPSHDHDMGALGGAIGSFAAGMLGGIIASEMVDAIEDTFDRDHNGEFLDDPFDDFDGDDV
jgi:sporulation-control protein